MPLSAGSSSQAPCGRDFSTLNPLPHTPVRHPSFHDTPFCPYFLCRIWKNTKRVRGVRGETPSFWGGPDEKEEAGRIFPVPPLVLFLTNSPTSCAFDPAPPGPFAYSPGFGGPSPLSPFHSPPSLIDLARWMLHCPLRPLTVCPTHSPTFEPITAGCPTYPHPPDALPCLSCLQLSS